MQCRNCQFQNMPGVAVCGRCATSLSLGAEIDIHPPRAGGATLAMRRVFSSQAMRVRWRDRADAILALFRGHAIARTPLERWAAARARAERLEEGLPEHVSSGGLIVRAIVAGWPQWYAGQRVRGVLFFVPWMAFVWLGLIDVLTAGSGIAFGVAIAIHSAAWIDVVRRAWSDESYILRVGRAMMMSFLLMMIVYAFPAWLLGEFAQPRRVNYPAGPALQAGDVVLANTRGSPAVGRLVLYEIGRIQTASQNHRTDYIEGEAIDRVLAGPGDLVWCRGGVLYVGGKPSVAAWVNSRFTPPDFREASVPQGTWLILPSGVPGIDHGVNTVERLMFVPATSITGVAWLQTRPWFGRRPA